MGFWDRVKSILAVRKNSTGSEFRRRRLNLIEGSNVTLTVADDRADDEIDITIAAAGSSGGGAGNVIYGDGTDGICTWAGGAVTGFSYLSNVYTMTRNVYCADISNLNVGYTIKPMGFQLRCNGTLTVDGHISGDGTAGTHGSVGQGLTQYTSTSAQIYGPGKDGSGGRDTDAAGIAGSGIAVNGVGGSGGAGGSGNGGIRAGGAAGTVVAPIAALGGVNALRDIMCLLSGHLHTSAGPWTRLDAGGGGGGGGGDGVGSAGAGGGSGVAVFVAAKTFAGSGSITSIGGAGGPALAGNCGGGGGGGGGWVGTIANGTLGTVTTSVAGGALGAGTGTGVAGVAGASGNSVHLNNS